MKSKISIPKKIKVGSSKSAWRWRQRKPVLVLALVLSFILLTLLASGIYFILLPASKVTAAANNIGSALNSLRQDFDSKDLSNLDNYVASIRSELDNINAEVDRYSFLQQVEFTKGYYQNLQVLRQLSEKTQVLITDVLPDLKVILTAVGYKVDAGGQVVEDENGGELSGIIAELPKFVELYDDIELQVTDLVGIFNQLDPDYVPSIGSGSLKAKLIAAQSLTAQFPEVSGQVKQTLSVLPSLLGSAKPASFLIIYQNEKELRSSGGLLSAFGNLTINQGEIGDEITATDMWDLEGYISWTLGIDVGYRNIYGQNALMNFGCGSTYLRAQDSGIYPDLHLTMDMFTDYYDIANKYNPKKYPAYEHVVILNTFFASDIIGLVEPIEVDGKTITAANAAKEIFAETSSQPLDPAIRKEFIGKVASQLKLKFEAMSASDFPRVIQTLIRTIQQKNIAFYSKVPEVQSYFDELGLSGRIEKNFAGDYFHLNEAQNCSLKSNFYIYDSVTQNVTINEAGQIRKDVKVEWVNEKVHDPNEPFILSDSPLFRYRAWVRLFMPKGAEVISTDGYEKSIYFYWPVTYFDKKVEKQISDNVIYFDHRRLRESDPPRKHNLNVVYTLPASLNYTEELGYKLLIQKHPGKRDERYVVNINHAGSLTSVEFRLDRDKVLSYRSGVITVENFDKRLDEYYDLISNLQK